MDTVRKKKAIRFGYRPLKGLRWVLGLSRNIILDLINLEFSHEHGFWSNGSGQNN